MSKVSIVIPASKIEGDENFNSATMMVELLESIKKQTFTDYEVIVSDSAGDKEIQACLQTL